MKSWGSSTINCKAELWIRIWANKVNGPFLSGLIKKRTRPRMNKIVKWIMITSICAIFALDSIVLFSVKAGAAAVCQKPVADFTSNVTGDCMRLDVQFNDQSTNCSTSWSWDSEDNGTASIKNPAHNMQIQEPIQLLK